MKKIIAILCCILNGTLLCYGQIADIHLSVIKYANINEIKIETFNTDLKNSDTITGPKITSVTINRKDNTVIYNFHWKSSSEKFIFDKNWRQIGIEGENLTEYFDGEIRYYGKNEITNFIKSEASIDNPTKYKTTSINTTYQSLEKDVTIIQEISNLESDFPVIRFTKKKDEYKWFRKIQETTFYNSQCENFVDCHFKEYGKHKRRFSLFKGELKSETKQWYYNKSPLIYKYYYQKSELVKKVEKIDNKLTKIFEYHNGLIKNVFMIKGGKKVLFKRYSYR